MADFLDPMATINQYLAFVKLCHVLGGLYIWEFFTTLDYDWSVVRGRRPYRWTIWIYSLTRVSTLLAVIFTLISLDVAMPLDCQLWTILTFIFGYISSSAALLLIVLRIIAIWNKNKIFTILSTGIWLVYLAFVVQAIYQLYVVGGSDTCSLPNMQREKLAIIAMFTTDVVLILIHFLGLFHLRRGRGIGMFGLGRLLWKQGVILFLFVAGAELITVVFVCLDLSPLLNFMFMVPSMISMSMTATRLYTSLTDFTSSVDIVVDFERGRRATRPTNCKPPIPVVHVHVAREQYPTSQDTNLSFNISG